MQLAFDPPTKICRYCLRRKALDELKPDKAAKWGRQAVCLPCQNSVQGAQKLLRALRRGFSESKPHRQYVPELWAFQAGECAGCREPLPMRVLEVDHIVPRSNGGGDDLANLQLLCRPCNATKGNRTNAFLRAHLRFHGVI